MHNNEEILAVLDKLFRLGEHPASNPGEAANALALAQSLLLKYNLTRSQVVSHDQPQEPEGMGRVQITDETGHSWKVRLLSIIAKASLCRVLTAYKTSHLFGSYVNVQAVLTMYHWVGPELEWQAMKGYREYKNDEGSEASRTWKAAFFDGAFVAIKERLQPAATSFANTTGRDIVLANTASLDAAVHKVFPYISKGRSTFLRSNGDGYQAGKQAGGNVRFGSQGALASSSRALPARGGNSCANAP